VVNTLFASSVYHQVFRAKEVLSASYVPPSIEGRDEQLSKITNILMPTVFGDQCDNILVYGKPGVGKTLVIKKVTSQLAEANSTNIAYINCNEVRTESGVLLSICHALMPDRKIPHTGLDLELYYTNLWEILNMKKNSTIVVLDEIDRFKKNSFGVLNILSRSKENDKRLVRGTLSVIGISNNQSFYQDLDPSTMSSLSPQNIVFPPYNAEDLRKILQNRADLAFREHALTDVVVPLCAALGAREHGDARRALKLLESAGTQAVEEGVTQVTENHVRVAFSKYDAEVTQKIVLSLPLQQKVILLAIINASDINLRKKKTIKISTGDIHDPYRRLCETYNVEPLSQRRVSDYLNELETVGLINTYILSRGRYGRTKEISLIDQNENIRTLLTDSLNSR
jgi:cell division control protein 6